MRGILTLIALAGIGGAAAPAAQHPVTDHAIAREPERGLAPQITTAELRDVLAAGEAIVLDARPAEEFGMSHIPGAMNVSQKPGTPASLYISDVAEVRRLVSDRARPLVVYCNGPFCGKSRRFADELVVAGYRNVRRYQLGMPGWRMAGGVSVIEAAAIRRVAELDQTAVFVDGGLDHALEWLPRIVKLKPEEIARAKDDGRLPMTDHNTRIIVMAANGGEARVLAQAIATHAFHNVAYHDGDLAALRQETTPRYAPGDEVLKARESALSAGDPDAVLRLFADDAIVVTSSGRLLIDKEQIGAWIQDQVKRRQREEAGARQVQGARFGWSGTVWRADWETLGVSRLEVRQDAIVAEGRIRFFSTTFTPESAERLEAARKMAK